MRKSSYGRMRERQRAEEMHAARSVLMARSLGRCEAAVSPQCTGVGAHAHHVRMRSQGGTNEPENLLLVCLFCHSHIHHNPADSYERGFLKRSGL